MNLTGEWLPRPLGWGAGKEADLPCAGSSAWGQSPLRGLSDTEAEGPEQVAEFTRLKLKAEVVGEEF